MYRLFAAFAVAVSFVCLLTLGLSAQADLPPTPRTGQFTLPPFDPPPGTVITVTTTVDDLEDNGNCTLREAIQAANTDAAVDGCPAGDGEDLIVLAAKVYALTLIGPSEDDNATGDLDVRSSLVIRGAGAEETVIDANQIDRVLDVHADAVLEIFNLTLQNGHAPDGTPNGCGDAREDFCNGEDGGGLRNAGTLRMANCEIIDSQSGAGLHVSGRGTDSFSSNGGNGGGIVNDGSAYLQNVIVKANQSGSSIGFYGGEGGHGGGIANHSEMMITSSRVLSNSAGSSGSSDGSPVIPGGDGGGIFNTGILSITHSSIAYNDTGADGKCSHCDSGSGDGGGIANLGVLDVYNTVFHANATWSKSWGAGLYNSGTANLSTTNFSQNHILGKGYGVEPFPPGIHGERPDSGGGGIYNEGSLIADKIAIHENYIEYMGFGGGIYNKGLATLINSTISGNRSGDGTNDRYIAGGGGHGGGIYNESELSLDSVTISNNATGQGWQGDDVDCRGSWHGVWFTLWYCLDGEGAAIANEDGSVQIHNSIIAENSDNAGYEDCYGTLISRGYNLGDEYCSLSELYDIFAYSAWLAPLADNGGPTPTHALLFQSPALNNGSCTTIDGTSLTEDQRGEPRPQGSGCDIGAYESDLEKESLFLPLIGKDGE